MRTILFKAKKLSDGKWVKGSLVKTPFGTFIEWYEDSICNKEEVDSSTVCQFIGLTDCEGKEVWEGDIVEREIYDLYKGSTKVKAVVKYMDGEFVAITGGVPYSLYFKYIKVVGNKFDRKVRNEEV